MRFTTRWLRLWFTFEQRVDRRTYLASGLALAALKYPGGVTLVTAAEGAVCLLMALPLALTLGALGAPWAAASRCTTAGRR